MNSSFIFKAILMIWISSLLCQGKVIKSPETLTYTSWMKTMEFYHDIHGIHPSSWSQLSEEKDCSGFMENVSKDLPNFFTRYRFIPKGVDIRFDKSGRIIAMSTESQSSLGGSASPQISKRVIVVQTVVSKKELSTLILPESSLTVIFDNSGYKLSDFTGPSGSWEPEPNLDIFHTTEKVQPPVPRELESHVRSKGENFPKVFRERVSNFSRVSWWIFGGSAMFLFVAFTCLLCSKK